MRSPLGTFDDRPQIPRNVLFHNRGDGTFEEIAAYAGVTATDWSWQPRLSGRGPGRIRGHDHPHGFLP